MLVMVKLDPVFFRFVRCVAACSGAALGCVTMPESRSGKPPPPRAASLAELARLSRLPNRALLSGGGTAANKHCSMVLASMVGRGKGECRREESSGLSVRSMGRSAGKGGIGCFLESLPPAGGNFGEEIAIIF